MAQPFRFPRQFDIRIESSDECIAIRDAVKNKRTDIIHEEGKGIYRVVTVRQKTGTSLSVLIVTDDYETKLAALRAAIDEGYACDPATDIDGADLPALMEQFMNDLVARSNAERTAGKDKYRLAGGSIRFRLEYAVLLAKSIFPLATRARNSSVSVTPTNSHHAGLKPRTLCPPANRPSPASLK